MRNYLNGNCSLNSKDNNCKQRINDRLSVDLGHLVSVPQTSRFGRSRPDLASETFSVSVAAVITHLGSFSRTSSSKSRMIRNPGGAVMSVSQAELSGYWRGKPGLVTVTFGCWRDRITVLLQSGGHDSSSGSAIVKKFISGPGLSGLFYFRAYRRFGAVRTRSSLESRNHGRST